MPVAYNGVTVYAYSPWVAPDGYYDPFFSIMGVTLALTTVCPTCDASDVQISRGWFSSSKDKDDDPSGLLADAQISSGFSDGVKGDTDDFGTEGQPDPNATTTDLATPVPDPQVAALQSQVDALQGQVSSAAAQNADLKNELENQEAQNAAVEGKLDALTPASQTTKQKINVSSDVRDQMKKQVKEALATKQTLSIADIVASAKAEKQLFQTNKSLKVVQKAGGFCSLTTGDLLKFDQIPNDTDKMLAMRVVLSKPGSCAGDSVVLIRIVDAQDMLNGFKQRLEANAQRAHDVIVQAEQKPSPKASNG
jgi:hypothetical protein